jgi:TatD DNase family protein
LKFKVQIELLLKESKVPIILHQYLGNEIQTNRLLANEQIYFSFGKNLNQPKTSINLNQIPLNRIFFETDITSKNIQDVYLEFANLRQLDLMNLKQILCSNFESVFGLIP